jgi:glycosyltransferase involved in cell wall biosynthesis
MQIGINKKGLLHTFRFDAINWWITPLHYLKREVIERTNFSVHKIKVIPIGLNVEFFSSPKYTKREALKLLGINPQGTLLGIIGRVSEKKGQLFILEAVQQLRAMGHKLELLIFGSPTINDPESLVFYEKLLKKTDTEDLKDVIHFIPHKEDVLLFYNAIDIFTLASHSETYGMVTIEAMLSKIPIIATKSGGTSEILEDEALGFLYHYGNMGEFCEKFIELENSPVKSKLKVENAFETAKETYAKEKEVDAISEVILNW